MSESPSRGADDQDSAVLEVDLHGKVRHASKEWLTLTGIPPSMMIGRPISEFVSSADPEIFDRAADEMRQSDFTGGSVTVWATMAIPDRAPTETTSMRTGSGEIEAQGILVNVGRAGNEDDAVVWLISKHTPRPAVSVQLPHKLARTTGFAIDVFAAFLEQLADSVRSQAPELTLPPQELCRICERFVKSWWFERHHWLCAVEHKGESRIRASLDALSELRDDIQHQWATFNSQSAQPTPPVPAMSPVPHSVSIKHAVHVSSPLARSSSPVPITSPITQTCPVQMHLVDLIERCDSVLELDPSTVTADIHDTGNESLYGPHNAAVLFEIKNWPPMSPPKDLEAITETCGRQIDTIVAELTRYAKFLRYRRILWLEIETQVREAIETTIAAAESTDATVVIDQATLSGSGSSDGGDTDDDLLGALNREVPAKKLSDKETVVSSTAPSQAFPGDNPMSRRRSSADLLTSSVDASPAASNASMPVIEFPSASRSDERQGSPADTSEFEDGALASEDEEEVRYIMNLKRQRNSQSRRNSKESPNRSPHLSPHLSPKLWPVTPSRRLSRSVLAGNIPHNQSAVMRRQSAASLLSGSSQSNAENQDDIITSPSIRDYEILKAISRGAYGVVYLARKRITNDFFAIKVLKKSDMVAKNQVTHIKHERKIMISTATSPYVATLYYSFRSRDYLYLVMEYVPGGDVAALLKTVGCITESWAKQYIAEVCVALDSLHSQGIVHRDLKPDNLLIDSSGHLKLSDFGLSAVTTKVKNRSRTSSIASDLSIGGGNGIATSPGSPKSVDPSLIATNLQGSHSPAQQTAISSAGSSVGPRRTTSTTSMDIARTARQKLLGTPDYLAPETIEGNSELTQAADWWSVGCIFFELVYGFPPFNDQTPQKVFNNILRGAINWPELPSKLDISPQAKQFILDLLKHNPEERLGANGSAEVMDHPFLSEIDWNHLFEIPAQYIPKADDPLSTANFDDRGALDIKLPNQESDLIFSLNSGVNTSSSVATEHTPSGLSTESTGVSSSPAALPFTKNRLLNNFNQMCGPISPASTGSSLSSAGGGVSVNNSTVGGFQTGSAESVPSPHALHSSANRPRRDSRNSESSNDEFGNFTYRNLPILERANNEVITKIRDEDRRLSFSGATSPVITPHLPSSPTQSGILSMQPSSNNSHFLDTRPASPGVMLVAPPPVVPTLPNVQQQSQQQHSVVPTTINNLYNTPPERTMSLSSSSSSSSMQLNQHMAEDPEREAAILRVRRRQLRRSMLSRSGSLRGTCLNVLVGGPNDYTSMLNEFDCTVHSCESASDVCLKANGMMLFDLILLDIPSTSSLPSTEVARIIRGTVNPNRETPILEVSTCPGTNSQLPSVNMKDHADLRRALKTYCNWSPSDIS